jgi:predicted nucleotidyltransferase
MNGLLENVLETIRTRRDEIEARYGVRLLGVVGSVARGDDRPDSDVDIIADVTGGAPTLFTIAHVQNVLEDLLGRPVDLVLRDELRPAALKQMTRHFAEA